MASDESMVMWRVTLHFRAADGRVEFAATKRFEVEAPENALEAAAHAGAKRLYDGMGKRWHCVVTRIDVTRIDLPVKELPSQQPQLWG